MEAGKTAWDVTARFQQKTMVMVVCSPGALAVARDLEAAADLAS